MSITEKLKSSGQWQTFEVIVLVIVQFTYFAIMARLLEKSDFGLMAIANSIIIFGNIFAESGMGSAIIQRKDLSHKHVNAAIQGSILTGGILFLIVFFASSYISVFFQMPGLNNIVKVIAVNFFLLSLSSVSIALLHKNFLFKQSSIVTTSSIFVAYSVGVVLALFEFGVWSLVYASILYAALKLIGYLFFAPIKFDLSVNVKEWKELYGFGLGMVFLKILNYMSNGGLIILLGKIFSSSVLGVFERTFSLKSVPSNYFGGILDKIMFPVMSEIQDEDQRLFKVYEYGLGISNAILLPVSFYLIFFSKEIVLILLGKDWIEAVLPLQVMFGVISLSISSRMADSVIRAKGYVYKNVFRKFVYVLVLFITVASGAFYKGLIGAAIAVTFSQLINYGLMLFLVKKMFKKKLKEIFVKPVTEGILLSISLIPIFIIYSLTKNYVDINEIFGFIIMTIFLSAIVTYLILNRTDLLGSYLSRAIHSSLKKSTSK